MEEETAHSKLDEIAHVCTRLDLSVHTSCTRKPECTRVATFTQLASGNWRVQVRRKTRYVAETFRRRKDGEEWALEMERNIDRNGSSKPRVVRNVRTLGDLIDLHDEDMREVGKPPRRSKAAVMASLKTKLGSVKLPALNRERLIEFGRKRAKQGAGPATLAIDLSFIRTIVTHAVAVHGIEVSAEEARLARVALSHLNLVGKSKERDRRPTQDELDELIEYFETNRRQFIPMGRIVRYAVATTLRQEEICKPEWPLVDMKKRLVVIQDASGTTRQMSGRYFLLISEELRCLEGRPLRHSLILDRA